MDRITFEERLLAAGSDCREFALRFVEESLPTALRFRLCLNASYDGNPLHPDERVFPRDAGLMLNDCSTEDVVATLWRDGLVPEWINVSVVDETGESTLIEVLACGRFTQNDDLLYHRHERRPPFHVLGPTLPPDWTEGQRFSIHHRTECTSPADFDRALRHARKIWSLRVEGPASEFAPLTEFSALEILELEGVQVIPSALPLTLQTLRVSFASPVSQRFDDGPRLGCITTLALTNLAERPEGLASFIRRCPSLSWLTLTAPGDLEIEAGSLPRTLEQLTVTASRLRGEFNLPTQVDQLSLHLSGETVPRVTQLLRSVRRAIGFSLRGTPVDDALVDTLVARTQIRYLDLVDTGVSETKLREITLSRPTLRVYPRVDLGELSPSAVRAIVDGALRDERSRCEARRVSPELVLVTPFDDDEPVRHMWLVFVRGDDLGVLFDPVNHWWVVAKRNESSGWDSLSIANRLDGAFE